MATEMEHMILRYTEDDEVDVTSVDEDDFTSGPSTFLVGIIGRGPKESVMVLFILVLIIVIIVVLLHGCKDMCIVWWWIVNYRNQKMSHLQQW